MLDATNDADVRPQTLTIELAKPIEFQKGAYQALALREPTVGEMRKADGQCRNSVNMETLRLRDIHLVAMVSGWPVPAVEMMPISKLEEASKFLLGFIETGPKTGES
jgi:hypothetical protein